MRFEVRNDAEGCDGWAVVDTENGDTVDSCLVDGTDEANHIAALERALELEAGDAEPASDPEVEVVPEAVPATPPPPGAAAAAETDSPPVAAPVAGRSWRGVLALAGARTQDDRIYAALTWRDGSLDLAVQDQAQHSYDPAGGIVGGRITRVEAVGDVILGWGTFDETPAGERGLELVTPGPHGVSVDLADIDQDVTMECRAEGEVEDPFTGELVQACADSVFVYPHARIAGATLTPIPAFEEAWIELDDGAVADAAWSTAAVERALAVNEQRNEERRSRLEGRGHSLVASAIAAFPRRAAFERPEADVATPLTFDPDTGEVWGHLAIWGEHHIGVGAEPPHSPTNYAHFHTHRVPLDDGAQIAAGSITFGGGHADEGLSAAAARAHYDSTSTVAADLVAHDGQLGIWCAGAMRPGLTDAQIREVLGAAPSGDWRDIGQGLDLLVVHQVNVPGFMGAHHSHAVARYAEVTALAASGAPADGRVVTFLALAHGYPENGRRGLAAVKAELAALRRKVETMWDTGGRDQALVALAVGAGDEPLAASTPARPLAGRRTLSPGQQAAAAALGRSLPPAAATAPACSCQH